MKLFGFQQALQHLHYEQFAVFPRAAKMHELPENSFRLLRINGRATILAMIPSPTPGLAVRSRCHAADTDRFLCPGSGFVVRGRR
jgi:hypothetical protein